jgi:hypothetical protein
MNNPARYSIGTWDHEKCSYTQHESLSVPSFNITIGEIRIAFRELQKIGYTCHRFRDPDGSHDDNDPAVLVERTDGKPVLEIMRGWKR